MKKILIVIIILLVVGIALYFGLSGKDNLSRLNLNNSPSVLPDEGISGEGIPAEPDTIFQEPIVYNSLDRSYSHSSFSIKYPDGFKTSSNAVEGGEIVTVENPKGSGFQIFVAPFDEPFDRAQGRPGPITPERIWQDQPDLQINDPKNAQLDGAKALVFYSYDEDLGETFEVWTVRKGKLYQITGPKAAEKLIIETLETWRWK